MHLALGICAFPEPAVSWITEERLPSARGTSDKGEETVSEALDSFALKIASDLAVYDDPTADHFALSGC